MSTAPIATPANSADTPDTQTLVSMLQRRVFALEQRLATLDEAFDRKLQTFVLGLAHGMLQGTGVEVTTPTAAPEPIQFQLRPIGIAGESRNEDTYVIHRRGGRLYFLAAKLFHEDMSDSALNEHNMRIADLPQEQLEAQLPAGDPATVWVNIYSYQSAPQE